MKAPRLLHRALAATAVVAASTSLILHHPAPAALAQAPAITADTTANSAPAASEAADTPSHTAPVAVSIHSTSDTITTSDEEFLRTETARLDFPEQVTNVDYIVFATGSNNLNDTTLDYAQTQAPHLLNTSETKWAPGHLIIAVSMDPRRNGIYCGDDVCAALNLSGTSHLEGSLEAMKPSLRNNNIALGLFEGAKATTDPTIKHTPSAKKSRKIPWWPLLGFVTLVVVVATSSYSGHKRKQKPLTHRYNSIKEQWTAFAHELDDYDIRANSLSSVFADAQLRADWEKLRDGFVAVNDKLATIPDNPTESDLKPFANDLTDAGSILEKMRNARSNIDVIHDVEHGDVSTRIRQLNILHRELQRAMLTATDERHTQLLQQLDGKVLLLRDTPEDPRFVDELALIIEDIAVVTQEIAKTKYSDTASRTTPGLYSEDWWLGYGYHGYVPISTWESWHEMDHSSNASDSSGWASSSVDSSYSSSSFSGGGGSSSW